MCVCVCVCVCVWWRQFCSGVGSYAQVHAPSAICQVFYTIHQEHTFKHTHIAGVQQQHVAGRPRTSKHPHPIPLNANHTALHVNV